MIPALDTKVRNPVELIFLFILSVIKVPTYILKSIECHCFDSPKHFVYVSFGTCHAVTHSRSFLSL